MLQFKRLDKLFAGGYRPVDNVALLLAQEGYFYN